MARKVRVVVNKAEIERVTNSTDVEAYCLQLAQADADASNSQSSWGGYRAGVLDGERAGGIAWTADNRDDEARNQRLINNLGAGT